MARQEVRFPEDVTVRCDESFSFVVKVHADDSWELVDYRVHVDPRREAVELAELRREMEGL